MTISTAAAQLSILCMAEAAKSSASNDSLDQVDQAVTKTKQPEQAKGDISQAAETPKDSLLAAHEQTIDVDEITAAKVEQETSADQEQAMHSLHKMDDLDKTLSDMQVLNEIKSCVDESSNMSFGSHAIPPSTLLLKNVTMLKSIKSDPTDLSPSPLTPINPSLDLSDKQTGCMLSSPVTCVLAESPAPELKNPANNNIKSPPKSSCDREVFFSNNGHNNKKVLDSNNVNIKSESKDLLD